MPRILVVPRTLDTCPSGHITMLKEAGFDVDLFPPEREAYDDVATFREMIIRRGYDAVLAGSEPYTAELMDRVPMLRVIARVGVGYDAVDVAAATARRIAVTITPGTNEQAVAEHTIAMLLSVGHALLRRDRAVRQGEWPRNVLLPPVRTRTLGIVGLGRIGKAVATRALALGMRVIAHEPYPDQTFVAQHNIELVPLDELLGRSDYVSLHAPLSPATVGLINRRTLSQMKPGSVLINTARGGLVVEEDLIAALKNGPLSAAALDVFQKEPLPIDHPIRDLDNVLLSPHMAGADILAVSQMAEKAAQSVIDLYRGHWPAECVVNPDVGPDWKW